MVRRPGWSPATILDPFHEHVIVAPALIYKALQATLGMASAVPYYITAMFVLSLAAALLFAFLRVRVGEWLALAAILPILFLGASSEDLLWAFQIGFFGSVAAGIGMLLALDRGDRRGDRIAAGLAVLSLAFGSVGIPFALAAIVDVLVGPRPRRDRIVVAVAPVAAYAVWWLGWGHQAEHHLSFQNVLHLPGYVFDAAGAGFAALFGQQVNSNSDPGHPPLAFRILAVVVAIGVAIKVGRERRVSRGLAVTLTIAFSFWALAGLDRDFSRPPISNRFQYPSAVFILLVAGEALRGVRLPRTVVVGGLAIAVAAMLGGLALLGRERSSWNGFAESTFSALAAVELSGSAARPNYFIAEERIDVSVATYRDAVGRFGSPAYDEAELLERPGVYRDQADRTMAGAMGLGLTPAGASRLPDRRCRLLTAATAAEGVPVTAPRVTVTSRSSSPVEVLAGRFGEGLPVRVGVVRPRAGAALELPRGASRRPWRLGVETGRSEVCPIGG